ncbi:MAG TPA: nuclear transport factor 2 family protein [Vicinamibacterales bacterium]|nr:nuclear transport factor 2 family protein [Vicinamibacterales bacterium]
MAAKDSITKELYDAFQTLELDRWDAIVTQDVLINSPAGRDLHGLEILKAWGREFGGGFAYRIDLVDEHLALDDQGNGRGFITFTLHWKHAKEAFGLKPTGREGTSVETMLLTIRNGRISRIDVADNSLDLVIYMWDRGWNHPHDVRPEALIRGIDRRSSSQPATALRPTVEEPAVPMA